MFNWNIWSVSVAFISFLIIAPILAIFYSAFGGDTSLWPHLSSTVLPRYISNTLVLMLGVGCLSLIFGISTAWVVTRFNLDAVQISFEAIEPLKTEYLDIKLHASIVKKDGESILAGIRGSDEDYKGIATEYNELDLIGNTEIFKLLYRGGYDIEAYIMPQASTVIPIAKNQLYNESSEETLIRCIADLMDSHEANIPKGEVFSENAYRTG